MPPSATAAVNGLRNASVNLPASLNNTLHANLVQGVSTVGALATQACRSTSSTPTTTSPSTTSTPSSTTLSSTTTPTADPVEHHHHTEQHHHSCNQLDHSGYFHYGGRQRGHAARARLRRQLATGTGMGTGTAVTRGVNATTIQDPVSDRGASRGRRHVHVQLAFDQRFEADASRSSCSPSTWPTIPTFVSRFRREALAAARLVHPNIVQVFDFGLDESQHQHFIVMDACRRFLRRTAA